MEYTFSINGIEFTVGQVAYGLHADKWVWSNANESEPFDTAYEAQADAMRHVRQQEEDAEAEREQDEEDRRYGSYEQQVQSYWMSTRL